MNCSFMWRLKPAERSKRRGMCLMPLFISTICAVSLASCDAPCSETETCACFVGDGVVDPVAHETDETALLLQALDQCGFLFGQDLRVMGIHAQLFGKGAGRPLAVAGENADFALLGHAHR